MRVATAVSCSCHKVRRVTASYDRVPWQLRTLAEGILARRRYAVRARPTSSTAHCELYCYPKSGNHAARGIFAFGDATPAGLTACMAFVPPHQASQNTRTHPAVHRVSEFVRVYTRTDQDIPKSHHWRATTHTPNPAPINITSTKRAKPRVLHVLVLGATLVERV